MLANPNRAENRAPLRPRWSNQTKTIIVLLLLGLGIFLLSQFRAALRPFIVAIVLAYILIPLVSLLQQRLGIRRILAILLAYLIALVVLVGLPLLLIPPLVSESNVLNVDIQRFRSQLSMLSDQQYDIAGYPVSVESALEQITGSIQGLLEPIFTETIQFAIDAISSLVWVIFILIVSFYLVKDAQNLQRWLESLAPPDFLPDFIHLRSEISLVWGAFFRGQMTLAVVVAAILTAAGVLLGLPFALVMGILGGLLEFLPSLGHAIWFTLAGLLAFFAGSTWLPLPNWMFAILVMALHIFFQQFDLNYLIPRVIGRRVQLPPLVVILGIVTGALLAGVLGILLAAPTIASARIIGRYIYANLLDQDPFGSPVAPPLPPPNPRWWRKAGQDHHSDEHP